MTIAAAKGIARRIEAIENRLGLTVISQSRQRRGSQGRRHEKQNSA
jgi:hypothetical protein